MMERFFLTFVDVFHSTSLYFNGEVFGRSSMVVNNVRVSHLIGSTTLTPHTKWKGVNLVDALIDVKYTHSAKKTM